MNADASPLWTDEFYRTLVENAAEGMLTIDEDSDIVYANPAVEDILGYTPEELVGSSKMKIIPERLQPVHAEALRAYVESGDRNIDWDGIELPALHKDGHEVPTLISLREHEHGGERYFTGIIRDITDRRRRENKLQDQKERLDEFADILTHDIRNPLEVAQGFTEIAQNEHDVPELERISSALTRIDDLIEDVHALSKEGQRIGQREPFDLEECVRDAWNAVTTREATLVVDIEVGSVEADRSRFQELLENLFRNAIEHGGEDVTVRVATTDDGTQLIVSDDGPGIPASIRDDVFEHGFSSTDDGTGYGLSIVREIVEAHGWDIRISENDSGGARFSITVA